MKSNISSVRPIQRTPLLVALAAAGTILFHIGLSELNRRNAALFVIALGLGVALFHGAFGFAGAYRRWFQQGDTSVFTAQLWMIGLATLLFAPVLSGGTAFGEVISGAVAPVGASMILGAFLFGVGMQLGGGCGSGTLFSVGGGDPRMVVTLVFFCLGGFWGSLDLAWWRQFPEMPGVSFGEVLGHWPAAFLQLAVLVLIFRVIGRIHATSSQQQRTPQRLSARNLLHGPWPPLWSAITLAVLNWATLVVAGHPWAITWGLTLWGAKAIQLFGWDPATSAFWAAGFPRQALAEPVLNDPTSVMDIGIIIGALLAASLAGRLVLKFRIAPRPLLAAAIGGLLLGYGARLAYGCNIGAFFSGVASTSLHGWIWIIAALPGNWLGIKLRPYFHLH